MASPGFDISGYFREELREKPAKPSVFDIFAKLLLPIVLVLIGVYRRDSTAALVAFAVIAMVASFYKYLYGIAIRCANEFHDRRAARKAMKQFRGFCRDFSLYFDVSTSRNDTLAGILSDVSRRSSQGSPLKVDLGIAPVELFHSHMHWLNVRTGRDKLSAREFHALVGEFTGLVASYSSFCVYPVFRIFASELRERLMPHEKSQLNGFQGRFVVSVSAYQKFLKDLNDDFRLLPELPTGIMLPDPL